MDTVCLDLEHIAADYLAKLDIDQKTPSPDESLESSPEWAAVFLGGIRKFREIHPDGEARRAARRFGLSAAKDKYRFFWEFWQNADDAGATKLTFRFLENELVVENNGNPFSARDAYSTCFVASSQKEGIETQKGQFGIGFLSLMRICPEPEIHSGAFHFSLQRDYTYPASIEDHVFFQGTRVIARLVGDFDMMSMREELIRRMEEEILLYMTNLIAIEVSDEVSGIKKVIECGEKAQDSSPNSIRIGEHEWLRYIDPLKPPAGIQREDGEPVPEKLEIILARSDSVPGPHKVAAFFPTSLIHKLPWRFSAPFELTNNRESLQESDYNRWLLACVGRSMIKAAIDHSVGDPERPWRLVPGKEVAEEELAPLYEGAHTLMKELQWIPTSKGKRKPCQVAIPASSEIRKLIDPQKIKDPSVSDRAWIRGEIGNDHSDLLESLGSYLVCCHDLSKVLASGPDKTPEWYLRATAETIRLVTDLYDDTSPVFASLMEGKCFKDQRGRPFSLKEVSAAGKVVCNTRNQDLAVEIVRMASPFLVVLHSIYRAPDRKRDDPLDGLRSRINEWLREESGDFTFKYEYRLDGPQFIKHFIADADADHFSNLDDRTYDDLLSFVRDHFDAYASNYRHERRLEVIGQKIKVAAFHFDTNGKRVPVRLRISETYLGKSYGDSPWAELARGVPGIAWLGSKYKKLLARESEKLSIGAFLGQLGARETPRIRRVPDDWSHGSHRFAYVTRGDKTKYPHFPHEKSRCYSEYGIRGDHISQDISLVLGYIEKLSDQAKAERGQVLLRMLEYCWEALKYTATAEACGYQSNGEHIIDSIPARWLFELRTRPWMKFGNGDFRKPEGGYAANDKVKNILGARDPEVSAWESKKEETADALGLQVDVSALSIVDRLRRWKLSDIPLSESRAIAYYSELAKLVTDNSDFLRAFWNEDLIYFPARERKWWSPGLCLTTNHKEIFGGRRAYLTPYKEAQPLWRALNIEVEPTLQNLTVFWSELSTIEPDTGIMQQLERSYEIANKLCKTCQKEEVVPVWTTHGWRASNTVVAAEDERLWNAIQEAAPPRWIQPRPQAFPEFCQWAQICFIDAYAKYGSPPQNARKSEQETRALRLAIDRLSEDVATNNPVLWKKIAEQAHDWIQKEVVRVDSLEVEVEVDLPDGDVLRASIGRDALIHEGKLYLSAFTKVEDPEVVPCLLAGITLTGSEIWSISNVMRLKLLEAVHEDLGYEYEPKLPPVPDNNVEEQNSLFPEEGAEGDSYESALAVCGTSIIETADVSTQSSQPEPFPPIEDYEVESDIAGIGESREGGPVELQKPSLRSPQRPKQGGTPQRRAGKIPVLTIEERGLALLVELVLGPEGIRISDQRLHRGVGADLFCSDQVFRELKTFSGRAPNRIKLLRHEHARAMSSSDRYQLVVVESISNDPTIVMITNPLQALNWQPTGDVTVTDWRDKSAHFRVVRIRRAKS